MRHVRGRRRNGRRSAASSALAKTAHIAITPQAENDVGDAKRSASITSGGLLPTDTGCVKGLTDPLANGRWRGGALTVHFVKA